MANNYEQTLPPGVSTPQLVPSSESAQYPPQSEHSVSSQRSAGQLGNEPKSTQQPVEIKKCFECGGWGVGLVQLWGYCNHCIRFLGISECQLLSLYQAANDASISKPRCAELIHDDKVFVEDDGGLSAPKN